MKIYMFWVTMFLLIQGGLAEENQENPKKWTGDISLGLALARGNTDTSNLSLSFSAKRKFKAKLGWTNSGFFLSGKSQGSINAESLGIASSINWKHSQRFYSYYKFQGIRDRFKNYDYRLLPTVGVGYKVISSENTEISFDIGLSQVFTKYRDSGENESHTGISLGDNLTWKVSTTAELTQQLTLISDISELSHYFARIELNLAAAITKGWAVKISLIDSYDNQPVGEGIKKNDVTFLAGLSMKF